MVRKLTIACSCRIRSSENHEVGAGSFSPVNKHAIKMSTIVQGTEATKLAQSMVWKLDQDNRLSATLVGPKGGEQYMTTCYRYFPPYRTSSFPSQSLFLVKDRAECSTSDFVAEVIVKFVQDK